MKFERLSHDILASPRCVQRVSYTCALDVQPKPSDAFVQNVHVNNVSVMCLEFLPLSVRTLSLIKSWIFAGDRVSNGSPRTTVKRSRSQAVCQRTNKTVAALPRRSLSYFSPIDPQDPPSDLWRQRPISWLDTDSCSKVCGKRM